MGGVGWARGGEIVCSAQGEMSIPQARLDCKHDRAGNTGMIMRNKTNSRLR